jgi:hypothetical protein
MMELTVDCGGRFIIRNTELGQKFMVHLIIDPKGEYPLHVLEVLLFALLWHTERSGVRDMTIVLVQMRRDKVYIPLHESTTPFVHEFDVRGFGVLLPRHQAETLGGGFL